MKFSIASVVLLLFTSVNCKDCWVKGRCQGFLVDLSMTSTQEDCLSHCQDLSQCKWFTYDNAHGSCATFSTCSTWDTECETCISGEFDCQVHTSNLPMFFTIISYAPKGPAQCFVTGRCTQSISVSIDFTDNAEDCLYACKAHAECAWFSFDPAMKSCILLSECNTLDTSKYGMGCSRCISGQKECDESNGSGGKCWIPGRCKGVMIGLEKTCSQKDCLGACQANGNCNFFTYDARTQFCEMLSGCSTVDNSCLTCVSGEDQCSVNYLANAFEKYVNKRWNWNTNK